ncbi:MAG: M15 family metallopeptidase [Bacteroidales bacterium]|nr:M15 family metallopeptidase [Bacteroidales bacterium]
MQHLYLIATLAIPLFLATCTQKGEQSATKTRTFMQITAAVNDPAHKISNMFDDMKYTAFAPDEMRTYNLKITKSTISSIKFTPAKRRGYSTDFTLFVKIAGQYYKCTGNNPELNIKPVSTDSLSFVIVSNVKDRRAEFVKDSLSSVAISTAEPRHIHAIERIDIYNNDILLNDSAQVTVSEADSQTGNLHRSFADNYKSYLFGALANKIISISNNGFKASWVIRSNGIAAFFTEGKRYFEGTVENRNGRNFLHITNAIGFTPPSEVELRIVANNLVIPQMKLALPFDGCDADFINLKLFPELFRFDIRYATQNNFTHSVLYEEPFCYMRYTPARDLIKIAQDFLEKGYKIKIFDGYRPHSIQYAMWKIIPNPNFLSDPAKGSIHNRGGAVDLTITTLDGKDLDMGTDFDHCGFEAYMTNLNLPSEVIANRTLLKEVMEKHGFRGIRTEWWHFSHLSAFSYPLANIRLKEFIEK